jgi:hypothetical protein
MPPPYLVTSNSFISIVKSTVIKNVAGTIFLGDTLAIFVLPLNF